MSTWPTILLVDDEPHALQLLGDVLEGEQAYRVVTAATVEAAQRLAELHTPSLIIIDVNLAGESGLDLCLWCRQNTLVRDSVIMMLTGASLTEQKLRGFEAGADEYLTKPFNPPELLSKVRALLRIKGMQDELKKDREELGRLNSELVSTLDAVTALMAVFYRGDIRIQKSTTQTTPVQSSAAAAAPQSAPHAPLPVETTRT